MKETKEKKMYLNRRYLDLVQFETLDYDLAECLVNLALLEFLFNAKNEHIVVTFNRNTQKKNERENKKKIF